MRDGGGDDVALKLLHTADWHLGKKFVGFEEQDRPKLSRERLSVIDRILNVAQASKVDAVLCAGDLFDVPDPDPEWWKGLADTFSRRSWTDRPVVLLPGNHDPLTPTSVYSATHPFRRQLPPWVHVVDRDDFELELSPKAVLLARPCRRQSGQADNALLLPARKEGDERLRVGMVHGQAFDIPGQQKPFPISKEAAKERGLDYLALGDLHEWTEMPPTTTPTVYPGPPEQTSFGEKEASTGFVALVFMRRHGRTPKIRKETVGRWKWRQETVQDLQALRDLFAWPDLAQTVLRLRVEILATPSEYEEVEGILEDLRGTSAKHGRVVALQVEKDGLELDASDIDAVFEAQPDVIKATAKALKAELATQPEVAQRALYQLYRLCREDA